MLDGTDLCLSHTYGRLNIVRERSVKSVLHETWVEDLVSRSPVSRDVGEGVGDELDEPVLRHDESVSSPEHKDASKDDGEGCKDPEVRHLHVVTGDELGDQVHLSESTQEEGGDHKVSDDDLDLVLSVESEHRLLLLVAGRLEDVVATLAQHQGGNAQVHSLAVVVEEDCVAVQEDGGGDEVEKLVDQVGVGSFVVNLLLLHDSVHCCSPALVQSLPSLLDGSRGVMTLL